MIATHAQIIVSIILALFTQGIATSFIPDNFVLPILNNTWLFWKLPFFFAGVGFFGGLAFAQWTKLFWFARLWNVALVAKARTFESVYHRRPEQENFAETRFSELHLGVYQLLIETCPSWHALIIFLGKETKHELALSSLTGLLLFSFFTSLEALLPWWLFFLSFAILCLYLFWVRFAKCCSRGQIGQWLRPELDRLARKTE